MNSNDARFSSAQTTDVAEQRANARRRLGGVTLLLGLGAALGFAACGGDDTGGSNGSNVSNGGSSGTNGGTGGNGGTSSATAGQSNAGGANSAGGNGGSGGGAGGAGGGTGGAGGALTGGGGQGGAGGAGGMTACNPSPGKAILFNGDVADLMLVDIATDLPIARASRTVEMWADFSGPKAWRGEHSLMEYGKGQPCHVFGIDVESWANNVAKLDPYGNGCGADNTFTLAPAVPEMGWLHLAWSYDGTANMFQFTVNGIKQPITSLTAQAGFTTTQSAITIGAAAEFGTAGFDGKIDEFRVWNIARTEADIKRDMKVMLKGTEPGLVAYFHFDDVPADPAAMNLKLADANGKMRSYTLPSQVKPTWVASDIPGTFTCAP